MEAQVALLKAELEKEQESHRTDMQQLERKFLEDKSRVAREHTEQYEVRVVHRAVCEPTVYVGVARWALSLFCVCVCAAAVLLRTFDCGYA
jgi:hypothetical protein